MSLTLSCPNYSAPLPGPQSAPSALPAGWRCPGRSPPRLWEVDHEPATLQQRRSSLLQTLRAGLPTAGAPWSVRDPAQSRPDTRWQTSSP
ncbi:MAG: hypothetical protein AVDCRST_MAG75-525 [uncultured Propionibacteriaceae bacterium]|uniref:Uncharacterized protein n=1 Tax=uncultured Propionibacteriaceae bacterium TaxID=257457 RepID=A0A6J4N230_9ACTN|nr:MAG: hypothetical protein AVDCRST_MAG75-525 [uncultured Propionibacteriaceae bacterium]